MWYAFAFVCWRSRTASHALQVHPIAAVEIEVSPWSYEEETKKGRWTPLATKATIRILSSLYPFSHCHSQRPRSRSSRLRASRSRFPHWGDQISRGPGQERPSSPIRAFLGRGLGSKRMDRVRGR